MPKDTFAIPVYTRHAGGRLGNRVIPATLLPSGAAILLTVTATGFLDVPAVLSPIAGGSFLGAISRSPVYPRHKPGFPGRDRYSSSVGIIMQTLPENRPAVVHLWDYVQSIKLVAPVCPYQKESLYA